MRTTRRYLASEIYRSSTGVLIALLALFTFFALLDELDSVSANFSLASLLLLQALQIPTRLYDLLPIGVLIGAVLALASLAQRNELIILRVSGVSARNLLKQLWILTIPIMVLAFVLSEYITPAAEIQSNQVSLKYLNKSSNSTRMDSGYWFREPGQNNTIRIINIAALNGTNQVSDVKIMTYHKDSGEFSRLIQAQTGYFNDKNELVLQNITKTANLLKDEGILNKNVDTLPKEPIVSVEHSATLSLSTTLTPERLLAGELEPERMSIASLLDYIQYLNKNNLQTKRQDVALWRKISYPFTLLVMITIAAPIGFVQTRKGGVGAKVFIGILIGVGFYMVNQLALNLAMLSNLPPWVTALVPSILALSLALFALYYIEARHSQKNKKQNISKAKL